MAHTWNNLKEYKCPRCRCALVFDEDTGNYDCGRPKCTFKISEDALLKMLNKLHQPVKAKPAPPFHSEEENLEELNKL